MSNIKNLSTQQKVELLKELYEDVAGQGRDGDTTLAHITASEAALLRAHGGSGTINPNTGLPEYKKAVKAIASVASFVSPYLGPIGAVFSAVSYLQERRQAKKAAKAEKTRSALAQQQEERAQRMEDVRAQRARVEEQRRARLKAGQILAAGGTSGLGMTGTAPMLGAIGAVSTQMGSNIGDINVEQSYAQEQSQSNIAQAQQQSKIYEAQASAAGWQQLGTMASNLPGTFTNIFNIEK